MTPEPLSSLSCTEAKHEEGRVAANNNCTGVQHRKVFFIFYFSRLEGRTSNERTLWERN